MSLLNVLLSNCAALIFALLLLCTPLCVDTVIIVTTILFLGLWGILEVMDNAVMVEAIFKELQARPTDAGGEHGRK